MGDAVGQQISRVWVHNARGGEGVVDLGDVRDHGGHGLPGVAQEADDPPVGEGIVQCLETEGKRRVLRDKNNFSGIRYRIMSGVQMTLNTLFVKSKY